MAKADHIFRIDALIRDECCRQIADVIEGNGGREVFFVGKVDEDGRVADVEAYAFGTDTAVPAVIHQAQYGDVVLHNHPSGNLEPSPADISIASTLGDAGVGTYIVDNACGRIRVVVRAFRPKTIKRVEADEIGRLLGPKGILARSLDDYEHRPQQVEMARAVSEAFNHDRIAVVEAGTGVGKSMAYLLPALRWAIDNKQRVVVSTNTINLQEQLIRKDLPLLQKYSGWTFSSSLVKGRQNYVCLRRVRSMRGEILQPEFEAVRGELDHLLEWALSTEDGSLADLATRPSDEAWDAIKVEADNCTRTQCPFYNRCFFYEARRAASRANVIVCNHHILLADLALRFQTDNYTASAVLPPFQRLIIDEAHNLEEVATNYLGLRMTRRGMRYLLGRIYATAGRAQPTGVLATVLRTLVTTDRQVETPGIARAVDFARHTVQPFVEEMRHRVDVECANVFDGALECLDRGALKPREEAPLRITPRVEAHPFYETVLAESLHSLGTGWSELARMLHSLAELLGDLEEAREDQSPWLRYEVEAFRDRALAMGADCAGFLKTDEKVCRWLELRRADDESIVRFCTAPVEVGPGLRRALFERCPTVVMTSATLTVDREFDYMLERLGLKRESERPATARAAGAFEDAAELPDVQVDETPQPVPLEKRLVTVSLDTPFDYERQAFVAVPVDVAEPNTPEYERDLESLILDSVTISRGRAFVLFTAYGLLYKMHNALKSRLEAAGLTVLRQGATNRHILLNRFRAERAPVLFATSSFWEGVDVRGDALVCLILTRLPFRVPTDPIVEARVEHLERQGRRPFDCYTVPQAVIKFKQGFGRLIRHKADRGAVLIFDRRVVTKRYGWKFLNSLPARTIHRLPRADLLAALRRFFAADGTD